MSKLQAEKGAELVKKVQNPYRPRTMRWALIEEDWSDLTLRQIADVFGCADTSVSMAMQDIYKRTGYRVPYVHLDSHGRPRYGSG